MLRRRRLITGLALLIVAALSALDHAGVFGYRGNDRDIYLNHSATVVQTGGGDLIEIDVPDRGSPRTRVRLCGVDGQLGRGAADWLAANVAGRRVRIEFDPTQSTREPDGRLRAYVFLLDDDTMVNETLIARGHAHADRPNPHVLKQRFVELERQAKKQRVGLWAEIAADQKPQRRR